MNTIQVYIWGVRYGFTEGTALFPERNRLTEASELQDYDNICRYFTSAKDVAFRSGQKDFYFLMQDASYRIYSFVDKTHQDIAGRETYLVYSIVCPKVNVINGNIKESLQNLKRLYKTRNADYSIRTNMFTNDQVRSVVSNLTLSPGSPRLPLSNSSAYYFQNDSELNLNDFSGNEVYFLQASSNPELLSHLGLSAQQSSLGQVNQQIQQNAQSIGEFRSLLSSKNNLTRATGLYNDVVNQLNQNEKTAFDNWSSQEKIQNAAVQLKQLIAQFIKNKATDIAPCETILSQYPGTATHLNPEENKALVEWQNQADSQKIAKENKTINDLTLEIENAATKNYEPQIESFENKLKSLGLEWRLSADAKPKLIKWREHHQGNTIILDVTALYSEIKRLDENNDRRAILSRQKEWNNKIDGFANRFEGKNLLHGSILEQYKYLHDGKWQRKERPIAKIATIALVVMLAGGGFFAAKNWDVLFPPVIGDAEGKEEKKETDEKKDNGNQTTSTEESKYTSLKYNNKDYLVEKSLLTLEGSKYGDGNPFGNGCTYRYLKDKNKWEMKESDYDKTWTEAKPSDIPIILKNWDAKFKAEEAKNKGELAQTTPQTPDAQVTTPPKVTTPQVTNTPPKDTKPPKVTKPPTEIPKVTPPTKKTLTPPERAAIYNKIEEDVKAGKCDRDCILKRCTEAQIDANKVKNLYNLL